MVGLHGRHYGKQSGSFTGECPVERGFLHALNEILIELVKYYFLLFLFIYFISCKETTYYEQKSNTEEKVIVEREVIPASSQNDNIGKPLLSIDFKLKATKDELDVFEDSIVPWISLENADAEVHRLIDADESVLPFSKVIVVVDYPLKSSFNFDLETKQKGFTRMQLALEIGKIYKRIYNEEEETASTKTIPVDKRKGLINRNETNGKYGLWGHDLSDLDLSSINVYQEDDGKIYLFVGVES